MEDKTIRSLISFCESGSELTHEMLKEIICGGFTFPKEENANVCNYSAEFSTVDGVSMTLGINYCGNAIYIDSLAFDGYTFETLGEE